MYLYFVLNNAFNPVAIWSDRKDFVACPQLKSLCGAYIQTSFGNMDANIIFLYIFVGEREGEKTEEKIFANEIMTWVLGWKSNIWGKIIKFIENRPGLEGLADAIRRHRSNKFEV